MKSDESLGQKEILLPIFKTLVILVKLLDLGIQLLILGVTRAFLAQFSMAKASAMTFTSLGNKTFPSHKQSHSNEDITSSRPT